MLCILLIYQSTNRSGANPDRVFLLKHYDLQVMKTMFILMFTIVLWNLLELSIIHVVCIMRILRNVCTFTAAIKIKISQLMKIRHETQPDIMISP